MRIKNRDSTLFSLMGDLLLRLPVTLAKLAQAGFIKNERTEHGEWTLMSRNSAIRNQIAGALRFENASRTAQVHFKVQDINNSAANDYIQAYTFMEARRLSAANVGLLNRVSGFLNANPDDTRHSIEDALGAAVQCPLGGDYKLSAFKDRKYWTSTAWQQPSLYLETEVPSTYRFGFLNWLRGLEIDFALSRTTLSSRVELDVKQAKPGRELQRVEVENRQAKDPDAGGQRATRPNTVITKRPVQDGRRTLSRRGLPAGVLITNSSSVPLVYEARGPNTRWGGPFTLSPGKSHIFKVDYPITFRRRMESEIKRYSLPTGFHSEFRVPKRGGSPRLFQVDKVPGDG